MSAHDSLAQPVAEPEEEMTDEDEFSDEELARIDKSYEQAKVDLGEGRLRTAQEFLAELERKHRLAG